MNIRNRWEYGSEQHRTNPIGNMYVESKWLSTQSELAAAVLFERGEV